MGHLREAKVTSSLVQSINENVISLKETVENVSNSNAATYADVAKQNVIETNKRPTLDFEAPYKETSIRIQGIPEFFSGNLDSQQSKRRRRAYSHINVSVFSQNFFPSIARFQISCKRFVNKLVSRSFVRSRGLLPFAFRSLALPSTLSQSISKKRE